ncbi:MAG: hypothetical protein AAF368_10665, partial [Planctomycetota bacterium]
MKRTKRNLLCGAFAMMWSVAGADDAPPENTCEKQPELLEARIACASTASCPCGTSCVFGQCTYECSSDDDCRGSTCDPFGQCAGVTSTLDALRESEDNYLQIAPARLVFSDDREATVALRLGRPQVESEVRISSSSDALVVACPGEQDFRRSCAVTLGAQRPTAVVRVQRLGEVEDVLDRSLQVRTNHRVRSIPIDFENASEPPELLRPGVFAGYAQLVSIVSSEVGQAPFESPLRLPVTVTVGAAGPRGSPVSMVDPLGLFGATNDPTPVFVGFLAVRETRAGLSFESAGPSVFSSVVHPRLPAADVLSEMTRLTQWQRTADGMTFELEQSLYSGPAELRLIWRFGLDETGAEPGPFARADQATRPDLGAQDRLVSTEWVSEVTFFERVGLGDIDDPYRRLESAICARDDRVLRFGDDLARGVDKTDTTNRPFVFLDGEVACARASGEALSEEERALERWPVFPILHGNVAAEDYEAVLVECLSEFGSAATILSPQCH